MKRKTTIVTEEYDANGALKNKTTETTEEEDAGYIYPQNNTYPWWPTSGQPIVPTSMGEIGIKG